MGLTFPALGSLRSKDVLVEGSWLPQQKGAILNHPPLDLLEEEEYREGKVKLTLITSLYCLLTGKQGQQPSLGFWESEASSLRSQFS